jgi:hypothetical protein
MRLHGGAIFGEGEDETVTVYVEKLRMYLLNLNVNVIPPWKLPCFYAFSQKKSCMLLYE